MTVSRLQLFGENSARENVNSALLELEAFFRSVRHTNPSQLETDFFRLILKKTIFWNYILLNENNADLQNYMNQLVSDLIDLLKYLILNDERPLFLISRSLIECYVRLLENINLENDHITLNVLNKFKDDFQNKVISVDEYSLIKELYSVSSATIHAGYLDGNLSHFIADHLDPQKITTHREKQLFRLHRKVLFALEKCFVDKYTNKVFSSFYREFNILAYLTNKGTQQAVLKKFEEM